MATMALQFALNRLFVVTSNLGSVFENVSIQFIRYSVFDWFGVVPVLYITSALIEKYVDLRNFLSNVRIINFYELAFLFNARIVMLIMLLLF